MKFAYIVGAAIFLFASYLDNFEPLHMMVAAVTIALPFCALYVAIRVFRAAFKR